VELKYSEYRKWKMLALTTERFIPEIYSPTSVGKILQPEEIAYVQSSKLAKKQNIEKRNVGK
jgi:hypothetical protein